MCYSAKINNTLLEVGITTTEEIEIALTILGILGILGVVSSQVVQLGSRASMFGVSQVKQVKTDEEMIGAGITTE